MTREKGALPKAYLRIDPNVDQTHPSVGEFVKVLCAANRQPTRGRFKNEAVLAAAVGRGIAKRSLERRDVVVEQDRLVVKGWDEWQEGDHTVAERMSRIRARHRNASVTLLRPSDVTGVSK